MWTRRAQTQAFDAYADYISCYEGVDPAVNNIMMKVVVQRSRPKMCEIYYLSGNEYEIYSLSVVFFVSLQLGM